MELALGIILIVISIILIVSVLMQSGKQRNLSGTIAGGSADTFFGKNKGNSKEKLFEKITTICAVIFVLLVLVFYVSQDNGGYTGKYDGKDNVTSTATAEPTATADISATVTTEPTATK